MALLTTRQAAERLKISIPRIHQLINEKRLPAEKVGRDYVIREEDLELVKDRPKAGRPPKAKGEVGSNAGKQRGRKKS
ncbi:MAG TPA: helix-turn-helix domain-containing protein [Pyrinomonadaceae bacterium]|nr:helix-turn-helix domain-containing protein [Pyrinomonadaceae bacterium]